MTPHVAPERDLRLQGHYAGLATRSTAFFFDVLAIVLVYDIFVRSIEFLVTALSGTQFRVTQLPVASWLFMIILAGFYCTYPVAAGGRTLGMAITGIRVVLADGSPVHGRGAVIRLLALPLGFLTLGVGFLLIILRDDRRAIQDLLAGTAVVYAWDAHAARLRLLARTPLRAGADS